MQPTTHVTLPGGLWLEDRTLQDAGLHPLTGYDEAHLLSLLGSLSPARWTSEVLVRCLSHIGDISPVPMDYVQTLTVGDREALLLHLRRLTFGERLSCVLNCPDCSTRLDVDLNVNQLLLPPYESFGYWFRVPLVERDLTVTFRLPTGADQEAIAALAARDLPKALALLVTRCVRTVVTQEDIELDKVPDDLVPTLGELMSERDPQAELILNNQCPDCSHSFSVMLDMGQFFAEELNQRIGFLYREVHFLAWYYHWSEAEIMQMTRQQRRIYLDLLDESLTEVRA